MGRSVGTKPGPKPTQDHGRLATYKRGCRCDSCSAVNASSNRAKRLRRGPVRTSFKYGGSELDVEVIDAAAFWARATSGSMYDCWVWRGRPDSDGYGVYQVKRGGFVYALRPHRLAYELHHGHIDASLVIDHLCRNKGCINPHHLELVEHRTNTLRGVGPTAVNARKTHCIHQRAYRPIGPDQPEMQGLHCEPQRRMAREPQNLGLLVPDTPKSSLYGDL